MVNIQMNTFPIKLLKENLGLASYENCRKSQESTSDAISLTNTLSGEIKEEIVKFETNDDLNENWAPKTQENQIDNNVEIYILQKHIKNEFTDLEMNKDLHDENFRIISQEITIEDNTRRDIIEGNMLLAEVKEETIGFDTNEHRIDEISGSESCKIAIDDNVQTNILANEIDKVIMDKSKTDMSGVTVKTELNQDVGDGNVEHDISNVEIDVMITGSYGTAVISNIKTEPDDLNTVLLNNSSCELPYCCRCCAVEFQSEECLKDHFKRNHAMKDFVTCKICRETMLRLDLSKSDLTRYKFKHGSSKNCETVKFDQFRENDKLLQKIKAPKSNAEKCKEYRERLKMMKGIEIQKKNAQKCKEYREKIKSIDSKKTPTAYKREYRLRRQSRILNIKSKSLLANGQPDA